MTIKKKIKQVRAGDVDAFRDVVKTIAPEIRYYLSLRLNDPHAVDDLTQEVLIAVYWSLDKYDGRNFSAWVKGITKNKYRQYLRKLNSKKEGVIAKSLPIYDYLENHLGVDEHDLKDKLNQLKDCLSKLPADLEQVISLRFYEAYSVQDIAKLQKSTPGAISALIYRIKKQLRLCMLKAGK